jgi:phosphatidylinositol alpha-1,6-mannosyltransferase
MTWPRLLGQFPDAVYVIFGCGPYGRDLRKLVADMKLERSVVFVDGDEDEKKALLAACEVFVMVSREIKKKGDAEGFGVVYLEAGACGKACVAGDSGGVRDAVKDGETGILVDPEDPGAVSEAIAKLLSDRALAARMGARGRERVLAEFDYRGGVAELNPIFQGEGRG